MDDKLIISPRRKDRLGKKKYGMRRDANENRI